MKVIIAGGGTGGHLFPGIAVAQELKRRSGDHQILFAGSPRGIEKDAVPKAGSRSSYCLYRACVEWAWLVQSKVY